MVENREVNREKGSIAIYAIATVLSFIFILGGIFFTSAVIRKNQLRTMIKIKEIYAQDIGRADEIGNKVAEEIKKNEENINIEPVEFQYTGAVQEWTVPATGKYKLEVWGAQGGNATKGSTSSGGKGGYSTGLISLVKENKIYVYVGEQGTESTENLTTGGFNGGGGNYSAGGGATGGGATDIRIKTDSLYARIIVAGGGSGAAWGNINGSAGGGIEGKNGALWNGYAAGIGGNQITGGGYSGTPTGGGQKQSITSGTFGIGGNGSGSSSGGSGGRRRMVWRPVEE